MTEEKAVKEYEKISFDVARHVSCLNDLYDKVHSINEEMGWDGMFEIEFEDALRKLGNVVAACVIYHLEGKYGKKTNSEGEN